MVVCLDTSGLIYNFIAALSTEVTGSFFISTLFIALLLIGMASMFGIPIEFTSILLLPLHIGFLACLGTDWLGMTGILLIYLGILLGKNFFFRS